MRLRAWNELPEWMRNEEVRKYHEILKRKRFTLMLKRFFDVVMSLLLLILLSWLFLILAIWIKADSKGTVFYRQERITQYGKRFRIYKFRTMVSDADKIGALVTTANDARITKVGAKIRKCRLDEIPQLINVLKGEMSFVGTRPEVEKYVREYSDGMKATLLLPAGVTSLSSLKYRDEDEMIKQGIDAGKNVDQIYSKEILPKKMKYNLVYLCEVGIVKDLIICVKTII
ncbi:MAG: sugar transferase [Erysipelotrichaceae bacterium]|nr:sugar transferase [Erysipelotrichaceae bacterium]MCI9312885.1 sugar transferase [Erysipelotrichaceae bacterium]